MLSWLFGEGQDGTPSLPNNATPHSMEDEVEDNAVINFIFAAAPSLDEHSTQYDIDAGLYDAAYQGNTQAVLDAIFLGGRPNVQNEAGNTSLHAASSNGHNDCLELLLKAVEYKSTSANQAGKWGNRPLHFCCGAKEITAGHVECVQLLLLHGAEGLSRNLAKKSPFDMIRNKNGEIQQRIATLLDKELINLCPWLNNEDTSNTTMTPESVFNTNRKSTANDEDEDEDENEVVHFLANATITTPTTSPQHSTPFILAKSIEKPKIIEPPPPTRKPLVPLLLRTSLVSDNDRVATTSTTTTTTTTRETTSTTWKHQDDGLFSNIEDEDDGLFEIDDEDVGLDEFTLHDLNDNDNDNNEYMTPMQLLRRLRMDLNREQKIMDVSELELWIDRLCDCKDEIASNKDMIEVDSMIETLENNLTQAFVTSAKKAKQIADIKRKEKNKQNAKDKEEKKAVIFAASTLNTNNDTITFNEEEMGRQIDQQIDQHIEAIGSTVNNVARKLLGVPLQMDSLISPTQPHRKEKVVVLVLPNKEYGLCAQFDESLVVTAFRNVPGINVAGPVEKEGVQKQDRLVRVGVVTVDGMKLDTCLELLKSESSVDGKIEMEFLRIVML